MAKVLLTCRVESSLQGWNKLLGQVGRGVSLKLLPIGAEEGTPWFDMLLPINLKFYTQRSSGFTWQGMFHQLRCSPETCSPPYLSQMLGSEELFKGMNRNLPIIEVSQPPTRRFSKTNPFPQIPEGTAYPGPLPGCVGVDTISKHWESQMWSHNSVFLFRVLL